ncbi:MAG: hypothetical protein L6W00_07955 [Lentisphaeria bacterium]|nr:MAG: hypothetical protein L6W00_07955 [Lentisphaeria bacterium]
MISSGKRIRFSIQYHRFAALAKAVDGFFGNFRSLSGRTGANGERKRGKFRFSG